MHKLKQPTAPARNVSEHGTDWDNLATVTDQDIQRGIDSDPDSAPALSYEEIKASYKPHPPRVRR